MTLLPRLLLPLLLSTPALAAIDPAAAGLTQGLQYQVLPLPPEPANAKPEIVYFFWVGCKYCARVEQALPAWLAARGDTIAFRRVPAVFRPVWRLHALAYYAADSLNQGDYFLKALYKALLEEGHELKTRDEMIAFAVSQGLDKTAFTEALDSAAVKARVLAAERLQKRYLLAGVPAMVIDNHYVSNGKMAGTVSQLLNITAVLSGTETPGAGEPTAPEPGPAAPVPEQQTAAPHP